MPIGVKDFSINIWNKSKNVFILIYTDETPKAPELITFVSCKILPYLFSS